MPFWQKRSEDWIKQLDAAPPQHTLLNLPRRVAVAVVVEQNSTHSQNFTPCNFWLFPRHEIGVKGHSCMAIDEIQQIMTAGLITILHQDI
jgi:hypothetical protein